MRVILNGVDVSRPEREQLYLTPEETCELLHVSRSHLPNLRANGTLDAYRLHDRGWWRYPADQPAFRAARADQARAQCAELIAQRRSERRTS